MRQDTKQKRQAQIEAAAYELLDDRGFSGTSMLAIARKAKASNETLYNWYGDKTGLFAALVRGNAAASRTYLEARIADEGDAIESLTSLGPALLVMLTGDRAVALNRAAAADPTGTLGTILAEEGRKTIAPLISNVLDHARNQQIFRCDDLSLLTETFLNLLIGDVQIRRVTGQVAAFTRQACEDRSNQALAQMKALFAPSR